MASELKTLVQGTFEEVKGRVVQALKTQGFGILTQIDLQQTLKEKIGAELERYEILGACNPSLAYRALNIDRSVGLFLPCNVVVREVDTGVEISFQDPWVMFAVTKPAVEDQIEPLVKEARTRLEQALHSLESEAKWP